MSDKCYMASVECGSQSYCIGYFYASSKKHALRMAKKEEPSGYDVEISISRCEGLDSLRDKFQYGENPNFVDIDEQKNKKTLSELGFAKKIKSHSYESNEDSIKICLYVDDDYTFFLEKQE